MCKVNRPVPVETCNIEHEANPDYRKILEDCVSKLDDWMPGDQAMALTSSIALLARWRTALLDAHHVRS